MRLHSPCSQGRLWLSGGTTQDGKRLRELDGFRGLAALSVVFGHVIGTLPQTPTLLALANSPLHLLWAGGAAVILFFVLSGFVLSLPFLQERSDLNYARFMVLRVFRIYPALWLALIISLLCLAVYQPSGMSGLSPWILSFWQHGVEGVPPRQIVEHFLLVPSFDNHLLNPPLWTLMVEIRMSAVLPVVIWLMRFRHAGMRFATLLGTIALSALSGVFHYLPIFAIGVLLAAYWPVALLIVKGMPKWFAAACFVVALLFYVGIAMPWVSRIGAPGYVWEYAAAIASALLFLLASGRPSFTRALKSAVVQFLGRISYSLYLLHFPILLLVTSWLYPIVGSIAVTMAVAIAVAVFVSHLSFEFVERPFIRYARQLLRLRAVERMIAVFSLSGRGAGA